jgi:serine/threonine protein kinase
MERIPYGNLHEKLAEIPLISVPKIISQIASAARFLENRGLAHRDIKPENIALSDDFTRAILLDPGVLLLIGCGKPYTSLRTRYVPLS